MTPDELKDIGRRLHGSRWKTALASDLGRHKITVWKWANGVHPIPEVAAKRIRHLTTQPHSQGGDDALR